VKPNLALQTDRLTATAELDVQQMLDYCLEHSKIQVLKMRDLEKKSAIKSI
jgi:hypothetical protein